VARQHGIAASADGDVQRGTRPARVGEAGSEPDLLDEALRLIGGLDASRFVAAPATVAMLFERFG